MESIVPGCRWWSEPFVVSMHLHLQLHLHFYGPISPSIVVCLPNMLIDDSSKLTLSAWSSCLQMLLLFALPQHTPNFSALAFDRNSCLFMLHVSLQFPFHPTRLALPRFALASAAAAHVAFRSVSPLPPSSNGVGSVDKPLLNLAILSFSPLFLLSFP